jgi:Ino eighty subunit 1
MTAPSSPSRPDPRTSLQHVLGDTHSGHNTPRRNGHHDDVTEDDVEASASKPGPKPKGSAAKGRGKGGGAKAADNPSIYAGNKIKHLKKVDGEPLWRKDIGYEFLKAIFDDKNKVFTNSYEPETLGKQTFSDLYIDTMARSSKTSKILRDKLLSDNEPAKNMAMVCLLVNVGRMNTTLNCEC